MSFLLDKEKTWFQRDFGLDSRLIKALSKLGFMYPTLVQSKSIPIVLQGKDVMVRARTGSGKTAAFALPLLHKILTLKDAETGRSQNIRAIVLAPTKELCKQIEKHIVELIYYCNDTISACSLSDDNLTVQQYRLKSKPDIIISTPAGLIKYLKTGNLDFSLVSTLVIDEADLMFSFGHKEDLQSIITKLPKIFQGLLLSATLSPELDKFKRLVLHNPAVLKLEENTGNGHLLQFFLETTENDKYLILYVFMKLGLLQGKGIIFVNDINKCYRLKLFLSQFFISAAVLNAELPINSRLHILEEFNRGVFDFLVATDASIDYGGDEEEEIDTEEWEKEEDTPRDDKDKVSTSKKRKEEEMDQVEDDGSNDNDDDSKDDNMEENDEIEDEDDDDDDTSEQNDSEDNDNDKEEDDQSEEEEEEEEDDAEITPQKAGEITETEAEVVSDKKKKSTKKTKKVPGNQPTSKRADAGYGVARGIDFQNVSFVVNFDFPRTTAAYTHRIGRTARAGASGTALSFVVDRINDHGVNDMNTLQEVQSQQPPLDPTESNAMLAALAPMDQSTVASGKSQAIPQPSQLQFNMSELNSFRYRVEDTLRSVTNAAVKEYRTAELKHEILNSTKLKSFFAENPNDLKVLRHDKAVLHPIRQKEHLRHVPEYLIPISMKSIVNPRDGKKKKRRRVAGQTQEHRAKLSKSKDPLHNFEDIDNDNNNQNDFEDDEGGRGDPEEDIAVTEKVFTNNESIGHSTSGRQSWKMRHRKGKFDPKMKANPLVTPGTFRNNKNKFLKSKK